MRKRMAWAILGACSLALADEPRTWTFDDDPAGSIARGFTSGEGRWVVEPSPDAKGKVLAQRAENPDKVFNVALLDRPEALDLDLSVRIKPLEGVEDRGGGLAWRAVDRDNYYLARYNPLEDNFRVYRVCKGVRSVFQDVDVPRRDGWRTIRVVMVGDRVECYLDGTKYLDINDPTFPNAGRVGVWSKADARTLFDDLTLKALPR